MSFLSFLFLVEEVVVPVEDATANVQKDVERNEECVDKLLAINQEIGDSTSECNQYVDYPDSFKSSNKDSPEGHVVLSERDSLTLTLNEFRWQHFCLIKLLLNWWFSSWGRLEHYLIIFIKLCNFRIVLRLVLHSLLLNLVNAQVEEDLNAVNHPENVD